jgi:Ca-activated chloride channel family protein
MRLETWPVVIIAFLVPIFHRWWKERNRPARLQFSLKIPASVAGKSPLPKLLLIRYIAIALVVLALARPQASFTTTERKVSGIDIMMVMDVSASMNIEDLADRPRLDIAKDTMEAFIKGRQNDRIGFVVFSGEPLTLAPPTLDDVILQRAVRDAKIGILKDGTGIGDGLSLAISRLKDSKAKSRIIILLTDGDNNVGQVDPATAGELAAGYGIKVYTIAIGREGRVKLPIRRQGLFGNTVTTYQWMDNALNPELLQQIAQQTSGKFYRVTDESTLDQVFKEIDQLERTDIKTTEKVNYDERFQTPLKLAFLLLVMEQLLRLFWWRMLP